MKNKKGVEIHFLIMLIIGIFVLLILSVLIPRLIGKGSSQTAAFFDSDSDGIIDRLDKCPCQLGEEDNHGCESGVDVTDKDKLKEINKDCKV